MLALSIGPLALGFCCQVATENRVAILQSGTRVPCQAAPPLGATEFATGWGRWLDLRDPVVAVRPASLHPETLATVRKIDFSSWVAHASRRGLLSQLLDAAEEKHPRHEKLDDEEMEILLATLEQWGRPLDPIPTQLKRQQRVDWLWTALQGSRQGRGALLTGRLLVEISGPSALPSNRLGLADLRRGLRSKNPAVRRAAGRLGAHQKEMDLVRPLAEASLQSKETLGRLHAASALQDLDADSALAVWSHALFRGRFQERLFAVENLGRSQISGAIQPLMVAVAASRRAPGRFVFCGRQVALVTDFDVEIAQAAAIAKPKISVLMEGAALEVRVVSSTLSRAACRSLRRLTGENPGPGEEDWLRWWEDRTMADG